MSDEDRISLQMVDRYQERLSEAIRLKMWRDCEALRKERKLDTLRKQPRWPEPERHRPGLREALELLAVLVFSCLAGACAAFGMWKLFN